MTRGRNRHRVLCVAFGTLVVAALGAGLAGCSGGSGSATFAGTSGRSNKAADTSSGSALSSAHPKNTTKKKKDKAVVPRASGSGPDPSTTNVAPPPPGGSTASTQAFADVGPGDFSSPSGNIGCYVDVGNGIRCDIKTRTWAPPPAPPSCQLDYGQGLVVDQGPGAFVCAGDTVLGSSNVLAYGAIAQRGPFRCDSEEDGMTCVDTQTGHGFFLSSQSYRAF